MDLKSLGILLVQQQIFLPTIILVKISLLLVLWRTIATIISTENKQDYEEYLAFGSS